MNGGSKHTLGEIISIVYDEFLARYGDEELASIATAAVINDILSSPATQRREEEAA